MAANQEVGTMHGGANMSGPANARRVRMGEAIRVRLEGWMRTAVDDHRAALSKGTSHGTSVGAAIRDLVAQALRGTSADAAYVSGFAQGFLAGYSDGKQAGQIRSPSATGAPEAAAGPIRPRPSRDNEDYREWGEGK
jgi:hypothetical protein